MGITSRVAAFAVGTTFDDVPREVIDVSKDMMLNAAGVGLAGAAQPDAQILTRYTEELGGPGECTVIGARFRAPAPNAALANGMLVHVLDFDENVERRANHPSNVLFPAVMAVGEQVGSSGRDVVAAFAVGVEASILIGAAGDLDAPYPRMASFGHSPGPVAGTFGATVAAGRLLGLDQEQMENALGIAAGQAAGLAANHGTSTKGFQAGRAAMSGIMAATLAKRGFTGVRTALEVDSGFYAAYRRDNDLDEDEFAARLGNPYNVIDPGVRLKIFPNSSLTHTTLEAVLRLREAHAIDPEQVAAVHVSMPPPRGKGAAKELHLGAALPHPKTGLEAKFSTPYAVAVALVYGPLQQHHFTDEAVDDPRIVPLLDKVTVSGDEVVDASAPHAATVTITMNDGSVLTYRATHPRGHRKNPVTAADIDAKFLGCSRDVLATDAALRVIAQFRDLEHLPDVRPLFASLAG